MCQYKDRCCDSGTPKCATCMHNTQRSYYEPYHEYPVDKWLNVPYEGAGDDLRLQTQTICDISDWNTPGT